MNSSYCSVCAHDWPTGLHSDACDKAVGWLVTDLPTMRAIVRVEHPNWSRAEVAVEAIRRIG